MQNRKVDLLNLYPFTTENISGYIDLFDLENKSLLTVGSSGDQVINAILRGCKDITVVDFNPYTSAYFYLKLACLLKIDQIDFFYFLRYKDFPNTSKNNVKGVFNHNTYNAIKDTLKDLNKDAYNFWESLFKRFDKTLIRESLFTQDEVKTSVISACNPYLKDDFEYKSIRSKYQDVNIRFVTDDIRTYIPDRKYDNIWLSNIKAYATREDFIKTISHMLKYLTEVSSLLVSYEYNEVDSKINELSKLLDIPIKSVPFRSINGMNYHDSNLFDYALVYKKK